MKNKKIIVGLILVAILVFVGVGLTNVRSQSTEIGISQETISFDNLIPVNFSIMIGDHGIYGNYSDWSYYVEKYDWCTGNGTEENPWVIEGIHVTNKNMTAHISIEKAEHFIIRNVAVSNYAKPAGHHIFAGIYIGKGEYGLIENCSIVKCSHGICLSEAKDSLKITNCNFIGSHDDPKTGLGCAIIIREAKGVEISYNDIYNYYSGIVVKNAEEIYVNNNRIETCFGHISDTGVYFYTVDDSEITNNDFYGCKIDGHESDAIPSGTDGLKTSFDNCYNIIVYGNRFYDLNGNLIEVDDDPIDEDGDKEIGQIRDNPLIFCVFIVVIVSIVAVFGCVVKYIKKKKKN